MPDEGASQGQALSSADGGHHTGSVLLNIDGQNKHEPDRLFFELMMRYVNQQSIRVSSIQACAALLLIANAFLIASLFLWEQRTDSLEVPQTVLAILLGLAFIGSGALGTSSLCKTRLKFKEYPSIETADSYRPAAQGIWQDLQQDLDNMRDATCCLFWGTLVFLIALFLLFVFLVAALIAGH